MDLHACLLLKIPSNRNMHVIMDAMDLHACLLLKMQFSHKVSGNPIRLVVLYFNNLENLIFVNLNKQK